VEKANDPQPAHALATPRCGLGRSGETPAALKAPYTPGRPSRPGESSLSKGRDTPFIA